MTIIFIMLILLMAAKLGKLSAFLFFFALRSFMVLAIVGVVWMILGWNFNGNGPLWTIGIGGFLLASYDSLKAGVWVLPEPVPPTEAKPMAVRPRRARRGQ